MHGTWESIAISIFYAVKLHLSTSLYTRKNDEIAI